MPTGIFVALIKIRVCILIIKCYRTCYANLHVRRRYTENLLSSTIFFFFAFQHRKPILRNSRSAKYVRPNIGWENS